MTDDNRPMDPERLALMKTLIARTEVRHWAYVADAVDPVGVAEMLGELAEELLRAHDHHASVANNAKAELDVLRAHLLEQRTLLACERESSAIVATGFEQAVRERDQAILLYCEDMGRAYPKDPDATEGPS